MDLVILQDGLWKWCGTAISKLSPLDCEVISAEFRQCRSGIYVLLTRSHIPENMQPFTDKLIEILNDPPHVYQQQVCTRCKTLINLTTIDQLTSKNIYICDCMHAGQSHINLIYTMRPHQIGARYGGNVITLKKVCGDYVMFRARYSNTIPHVHEFSCTYCAAGSPLLCKSAARQYIADMTVCTIVAARIIFANHDDLYYTAKLIIIDLYVGAMIAKK